MAVLVKKNQKTKKQRERQSIKDLTQELKLERERELEERFQLIQIKKRRNKIKESRKKKICKQKTAAGPRECECLAGKLEVCMGVGEDRERGWNRTGIAIPVEPALCSICNTMSFQVSVIRFFLG